MPKPPSRPKAREAPVPAQPFEAAPQPRAFGTQLADLALPLDAALQPEAVDSLLSVCFDQSRAAVQLWSVAHRLDALVAIRQADGRITEAVNLHCGACRMPFEAELDLQACRLPLSDAGVSFEAGGRILQARLPTGAEQIRWQREATPVRSVAASLLDTAHDPDDETLAALNRALAERDPLREISLRPACPECGAVGEQTLDLEAHLVRCFAQQQRAWLDDIANLAEVYHWSEAEIAAMPAWRRTFYLQRLETR